MIYWQIQEGLANGATRYYRPGDVVCFQRLKYLFGLNQKAVIKSLGIRALSGPGVLYNNLYIGKWWQTPPGGFHNRYPVSNINVALCVNWIKQGGDSISLKVVTSATTAHN